jgi:hypothetical protein
MDQPVPAGETTTVICTGPVAARPCKAGADTPIEDGVGGGAVFAFKVSPRIADRWKRSSPGLTAIFPAAR